MMKRISKAELAARLEARVVCAAGANWLYITEVMDLSDYAGCDLT